MTRQGRFAFGWQLWVGWPRMKTFVASGVILWAAIHLVLGTVERSVAKSLVPVRARMVTIKAEVFALSADKAREEALGVLGDPSRFRCTTRVSRALEIEQLPPAVQALFGRYGRVEAIGGDLVLDLEEAAPSTVRPGFAAIGHDSAEIEILCSGLADEILKVDLTARGGEILARYPTVFHLILEEAALLKP